MLQWLNGFPSKQSSWIVRTGSPRTRLFKADFGSYIPAYIEMKIDLLKKKTPFSLLTFPVRDLNVGKWMQHSFTIYDLAICKAATEEQRGKLLQTAIPVRLHCVLLYHKCSQFFPTQTAGMCACQLCRKNFLIHTIVNDYDGWWNFIWVSQPVRVHTWGRQLTFF